MFEWFMDRPYLVIGTLIIGFVLPIGVHASSEERYKQDLLSRAHTFADTLKVHEIMAQRRTADAITFGAAMVAGSRSSR